MNMQDEILEELGTQMQSVMDFEILTDILVNACGWYRIELDRFQNNRQAVDMANWCHDTLKNKWKRNGCHFVFEDQGDAVNFTLRWL
jgi:hypothetical protein